MKRPLPIGYEDFREMIDKNFYYVDKTLMLRTLLDQPAKANLFTRPRRFGKTLNLSMIRRFFEMEMDEQGNRIDNGYLFQDLKISSCGGQYLSHQQQYPVIDLSLKSAKQPNFEMAREALVNELIKEYKRHYYLLSDPNLLAEDKEKYRRVLGEKGTALDYATALAFLSSCLAKHHDRKVIILIDEYDVPLENAWMEGFYDQMIAFVRSLFESALKTNSYLEFAVITGCLRISKESIFTGLNNLEIHSLLSPSYAASFGFTEEEVKEMLSYYGMDDKYDEVHRWYDGYLFGDQEIYNPWSIINYIKTASLDRNAFPQPYWSNTSSNNIIRELVEEADFETREELERLIAGETIEKPVHEDITYGEIHESKDNLWNFLYFTGYLKKTGERQEGRKRWLSLAIPNEEITAIYEDTILAWFDKKIKKEDLSPLFAAIEAGDCEAFGTFVSGQLLDTISFFDYAENYYHGFLTGLLKSGDRYGIRSNRESGVGRPDILMTSTTSGDSAVVLELKVADSFKKMESLCQQALDQIREQDYEAALRAEGYKDIKKYGVCFYQKKCLVMSMDE